MNNQKSGDEIVDTYKITMHIRIIYMVILGPVNLKMFTDNRDFNPKKQVRSFQVAKDLLISIRTTLFIFFLCCYSTKHKTVELC